MVVAQAIWREIDWMADQKIRYVFNADSNFGMHRRDQEIADYLVATKQRTGFPHKFRTCYGKNTDEKIFAIGRLFHEHGVRVFRAAAVEAKCSCSRERVAGILGSFSAEERAAMVEDGRIGVTCEFCNTRYTFTADEVTGPTA